MNKKSAAPIKRKFPIILMGVLLVVPDLLVEWDIKREASKWKQRITKQSEQNAPIHAPQLVELALQSSTTPLPSRISGHLELSPAESPYLVATRTTINSTASLTVPAGVEIWFAPHAYIVAFGPITMTGTAAQPVRLVAAKTNSPWAGLFIGGGRPSPWPLSLPSRLKSPWTSHLSHVHFDSSQYGVKAVHAVVRLENVVTRNVRELYSGQKCDTLIRQARFIYDQYETTGNVNLFKFSQGTMRVEDSQMQCPQTDKKMDAFDIDSVQSGYFVGNRIYGSPLPGTDGIDIGLGSQQVVVANNLIMNFSDKAISVGEGAQAVITNNVLAYCGIGVGIKDNSQARLIHNTFYQNRVGVACYEKNPGQGGGHGVVIGCLFLGHISRAISVDPLSDITVSLSACDLEPLPGPNNLQRALQLNNPAQLDFRIHPSSPMPAGPRVGASF
jgi:hypothetical protein